ncbi:MAG: T9SS type A sorting domain-containing protein, partial [Bacteroidetes bacterium]|nr:T9SS type A sorting domain-containing protein [Bacteroidota bacterium]
IEWEYSVAQDSSLSINQMQELIEIFDGYEISGNISGNINNAPIPANQRYRIQLNRNGKLVSEWKGKIEGETTVSNGGGSNLLSPALRGYYTPYMTFGTYNKDFDNIIVTPCLRWFDANGKLLNEVVYSDNKIASTGIFVEKMFLTTGGGLGVLISCEGTAPGDTNGFLQFWRLDRLGNVLWRKQLPETFKVHTNRQYSSAIQTKDGGYAVASIKDKNYNLKDSLIPILLRKFDSTGNLLFTKSYTPTLRSLVYSIKETPSSDFFLVGYGHDNSENKYNKYLVIKTTASGDIVWSDLFGETTTGNMIFDIAVVDDHSILLGGLDNYLVRVNQSHAVVMKMRDKAAAVSEQPAASDGIHLFPNPTSTQFTLSGVEGVASVRVVNSLGEEVKQFTHVSSQYSIDVSDLVSGLYFVSIRTAKGAVVKPMMVSR